MLKTLQSSTFRTKKTKLTPLIPLVIVHHYLIIADGLKITLEKTKRFNVIYCGSDIPDSQEIEFSSAILLISAEMGWHSRCELEKEFLSIIFLSRNTDLTKVINDCRVIYENENPQVLIDTCLESSTLKF